MDLYDTCRWARRRILEMGISSGAAHIAPSFSCVEILAALYGRVMQYDPGDPRWPQRDRLILSKGHASMALYAVLARAGYFPEADLDSYGLPGSRIGGMAEPHVAGVELSTGALGHGLSVGAGMALSARMRGESWHVFVVLGDGECQEGSVWEAAMFAAHHRLGNLVAIIDRNRLQALDPTEEVIPIEPITSRWGAFGWESFEVEGHDPYALARVLKTKAVPGVPRLVVARTVKGKGVSFMEGRPIWHYRVPEGDELSQARKELQ